ncbi:MAG: septum formation protein Maf [Paludibacteraceae bacterium]|nr:septum formation protein Maf [Paludibacteraceae bacterium]
MVNDKMVNIILGSQSPRRHELMSGLDIPFRTVSIDADESYPHDLTAGDIPLYISREKAQAYLPQLQPNELLITADTIVWLNGQMLGKPVNLEDARRMLHLLSGNTHQVYTAVTFTTLTGSQSLVDCTDVTFRMLTDKEIDYYVETYRPLDKAGAYGVQEYIGYIGVTAMHGSYFNVMGFPIGPVYDVLKQFGF